MCVEYWACEGIPVSVRLAEDCAWNGLGGIRTYLGSAEVQEERVAAKDPAEFRVRVLRQLVLRYPRLKDGERVEEPHGRGHGAPGA